MALKERWNCSGRKLGFSWAVDGVDRRAMIKRLQALAQYLPRICGRAVVVDVRENADFPSKMSKNVY